jgi:NAD+ synthetase
MKITLAQINPTIGDISGNSRLICEAARSVDSGLVLFPELALTGYYPADLLDSVSFIDRVYAGIDEIKRFSESLNSYLVIGAPTRNKGIGKPLFNSLLVIHKGEVIHTYNKQLLPNYDVFNERRHFESGTDTTSILDIDGLRVGFIICEDGWDDTTLYLFSPLSLLAPHKPNLIVSINASPSYIGKHVVRDTLFKGLKNGPFYRYSIPFVYVNAVGGHDELVFDGNSFVVNAEGDIVVRLPAFESAIQTFDFAQLETLPEVTSPEQNDAELMYKQIVLGLRDYARRCGFKSVVVGSSGGIDSALTLALATAALGYQNVTAIEMPSPYSSESSIADSALLCKNLGIKRLSIPINHSMTAIMESYESGTSANLTGVSLENLQARIRGTLLMAYSNMNGDLLLTTGNKSEIAVGYTTLYGDSNGGLNLIGDLYKTDVYALSRYINCDKEIIPHNILVKEPSAELSDGQKDSDSLPPYENLDAILKYLIESEPEPVDLPRDMIRKVSRMLAGSEYKRRQAAPIIKCRKKSFGRGRQIPLTAVQDED